MSGRESRESVQDPSRRAPPRPNEAAEGAAAGGKSAGNRNLARRPIRFLSSARPFSSDAKLTPVPLAAIHGRARSVAATAGRQRAKGEEQGGPGTRSSLGRATVEAVTAIMMHHDHCHHDDASRDDEWWSSVVVVVRASRFIKPVTLSIVAYDANDVGHSHSDHDHRHHA
jgi:hypothetical protein